VTRAAQLPIHRATEADCPAIVTFLRNHIESSMFPLSNLAHHGLGRDHPNAQRIWIETDGPDVTGLIALTEAGSLLPQFPPDRVELFAAAVDGEKVAMILGDARQVSVLRTALGLTRAPLRTLNVEPHFSLDLSDLIVPEGEGTLAPLSAAPTQLLVDWRVAYEVETFGGEPSALRADAARQIARWTADDSHRVLMSKGQPIAMTGFNARLPDIVQIGGVWTPPDLRRRGHARRAVALHLSEAQKAGVSRAVLFAASEPAARAYRAIGFRQIGEFSLCIFKKAQVVNV